jgi:hypothetical protein
MNGWHQAFFIGLFVFVAGAIFAFAQGEPPWGGVAITGAVACLAGMRLETKHERSGR